MSTTIHKLFPIYVLLFLGILSSGHSNAQNVPGIELETRKTSDAIKNIFNFFAYKELDAFHAGNENTIKLYSIRFHVDSNLNATNISVRGSAPEKLRQIVQTLTRAVFDSVRRMDIDFGAFKNKAIQVPLIMYIKPLEDKQMLSIMSEDMIAVRPPGADAN